MDYGEPWMFFNNALQHSAEFGPYVFLFVFITLVLLGFCAASAALSIWRNTGKRKQSNESPPSPDLILEKLSNVDEKMERVFRTMDKKEEGSVSRFNKLDDDHEGLAKEVKVLQLDMAGMKKDVEYIRKAVDKWSG